MLFYLSSSKLLCFHKWLLFQTNSFLPQGSGPALPVVGNPGPAGWRLIVTVCPAPASLLHSSAAVVCWSQLSRSATTGTCSLGLGDPPVRRWAVEGSR